MEITIYSTFKDFKINYIEDFKRLESSLKITFIDYLNECEKLYLNPQNYTLGTERILKEIEEIGNKYPQDKYFDNSDYHSKYLLDFPKFRDFEFEYNDDLSKMETRKKSDLEKYFNLKQNYLSRISQFDEENTEILSFINNEIFNQEQRLGNKSAEKKESFNTPQKIKILDALNIRGLLQEKGYTVTHIEKLLSDLFDVSDRTIRENLSKPTYEKMAKEYLENLKSTKSKH